MVYLIVFLAVVLVIGPVLWMRPSPRERHLTQLRQKAIMNRMNVQVPSKDDIKWMPVSEHIERHKIIRYALPIHDDDRDSEQLKKLLGHYQFEKGQWHSMATHLEKPPLPEAYGACLNPLVKEASCSVDFLDIQRGQLGVFWQEDGEASVVDDIVNSLSQLREALKTS